MAALALGYFLVNALVANGEHAGQRCFAPPDPRAQPLPSGTQLQDYQGHLFTLTVTCSYRTPDGTVIEQEKPSSELNALLWGRRRQAASPRPREARPGRFVPQPHRLMWCNRGHNAGHGCRGAVASQIGMPS